MEITAKELQFVARIYDAVLQPNSWLETIDEFCRLVDAKAGMLQVLDPVYTNHNYSVASLYYRDHPRFDQLSKAYFEKVWKKEQAAYEYLFECPDVGFNTEWVCMGYRSPADLKQHAPTHWLKENFGFYFRTASRLNMTRAWQDLLSLQYGDDRKAPVTQTEMDFGNLFLPHFAKTVEISRSFSVLKTRFNAVLEAVDHLHIGVFILNEKGEVLLRNNEANRILDQKDGLSVDVKNRLKTLGAMENLKAAVQALSSTSAGKGMEAERLMLLPKPKGSDPYILTVAPMRDPESALDRFFHGVIVYVVDPSNTSVVSTKGIAELYGLSLAEGEVCKALCQGMGARDIAEHRGVSYETTRTQIKNIMKKTNVSNRGSLIRLALSINLPIRDE